MGAPGTGKGTQAQILVKERGWLHVSSGDILRAAIRMDTQMGRQNQKIDLAVSIMVPEDELVRRLSGRWVCRRCAAIYQESSKPPTVPGRCDNCGGELIQRDDDRAETVRSRLEKQKPPQELLDY